MSDRRFHVSPADVRQDRLFLRAEEAHHARRVLRLREGDTIVCFDGEGHAWTGEIAAFTRDGAEVKVLESLPPEPQQRPRVTLAQAVLKGERMDLVVQKATELGAARIVPVLAERCVGGERASKREVRWRRIALEAAKQCERALVPAIDEPGPLASILTAPDGPLVVFVERSNETVTRLEILGSLAAVTVLVGPEGGWTERERKAMREAGAIEASLGPHVLRAETAAIAALAVVGYALR